MRILADDEIPFLDVLDVFVFVFPSICVFCFLSDVAIVVFVPLFVADEGMFSPLEEMDNAPGPCLLDDPCSLPLCIYFLDIPSVLVSHHHLFLKMHSPHPLLSLYFASSPSIHFPLLLFLGSFLVLEHQSSLPVVSSLYHRRFRLHLPLIKDFFSVDILSFPSVAVWSRPPLFVVFSYPVHLSVCSSSFLLLPVHYSSVFPLQSVPLLCILSLCLCLSAQGHQHSVVGAFVHLSSLRLLLLLLISLLSLVLVVVASL